MEISISISNLSKKIGLKEILFSNLNAELTNKEVVAIIGPNGSGKSTFLKILAGVTKSSSGEIKISINNQNIKISDFHTYFGYVAPYLNLYEEFHPLEHIQIISKILGLQYDKNETLKLLDRFGLLKHYLKPIRAFSSGMKQRMRIILSVLANPIVLLLDEPFSNLDDEGIKICQDLIVEKQNKNGLILIASNDEREIQLSTKKINLKDFK